MVVDVRRTAGSSRRWRSPALVGAGALLLGLGAALVRLAGCLAAADAHDPNVVFESDWSTDTGTSRRAVTDGGRWKNYWEFNNGAPVQLMSVVPGGPGGGNALRVMQRGSNPGYAAFVQQDNVVRPSTDYFVRYYMRNDDTSSVGDHIVTADMQAYANLTYMRRLSGSTGWRFVISLYGCEATYPLIHWGPIKPLALGAWYRFEYYVDFVDRTHVQVHVRVYDASGTQILGDEDFRQQGWGEALWNGRSDWTLKSYYAADHRFCVDPAALRQFGMGNNGQKDAVDSRLPWYFARVQIRTDWWPGP
ncbi:MAG: hypothetical protein DMD59_05035 [Gemmatimonadetes bacterium]|nr:MAG: hypothetical protein DMD59_05035 [Gemmatimonadota bacterium]